MSFQAYLDAVEVKTQLTPAELLQLATARGYGPDTKVGTITTWLKEEYGVGRGHAMAFVHVVKNGATISDKHVGTTGSHRDASAELRLRSAQIYHAIQLAGATYLIILGIAMLRSIKRKPTKTPRRFDLARGRGPLLTAYISNVVNPKAAGG